MFWGGFVRFELLGNNQEVSFSWVCSWDRDSLILMERTNSSPFSPLSSLHFCFIISFSEVLVLKLPLWKSRMNYKPRLEPNFSIFHFMTAVRVEWHQLVNIQHRKKIHLIDVSEFIYLIKKLTSHESANFPSVILIKCPDINVPEGGVGTWE